MYFLICMGLINSIVYYFSELEDVAKFVAHLVHVDVPSARALGCITGGTWLSAAQSSHKRWLESCALVPLLPLTFSVLSFSFFTFPFPTITLTFESTNNLLSEFLKRHELIMNGEQIYHFVLVYNA